MPFRVTAPPALEPVTTSELKAYLRVSDTSEDALLGTLITVARQSVEMQTRRPLITQTLTATFADWEEELPLPVGNALAISSVKYKDEANVEQTLAAANYFLLNAEQPGRVVFVDTFAEPNTYARSDAIAVAFTAGYGPAVSDVPEALKLAIKMLAAYWFEQRLPVNVGNIVNKMPLHVEALLNRFRVIAPEMEDVDPIWYYSGLL